MSQVTLSNQMGKQTKDNVGPGNPNGLLPLIHCILYSSWWPAVTTLLVILANVFKYPFFRFGADTTGHW